MVLIKADPKRALFIYGYKHWHTFN